MEEVLARAFTALQPIHGDIVVIGGSAHRLFHGHEWGQEPDYQLLTTEDVDVAAGLDLAIGPSIELLPRLTAAGFVERVAGADQPSYTYEYIPRPGAYLEFVAPLHGSGATRVGAANRELKFHGLHAEKLRNIDLLLHRPWTTSIEDLGEQVDVRVVNPVTYLLQKLLSLPTRRTLEKQGKDVLYLFDTVAIFGLRLPELRMAAPELAPDLTKKQIKAIATCANAICFVESDAVRQAAQIASSQRARAPVPQQVAGALKLALRQVLQPLIPNI